jgi:hypothetical protein
MFPPVAVKSAVNTRLGPVTVKVGELVRHPPVLLTSKGILNGSGSIPKENFTFIGGVIVNAKVRTAQISTSKLVSIPYD